MNSETQHFTMQASFSEERWEPLSLLNPPWDAFFPLQSGHRFGCFFYICLWVSLCSYSCANQQKHELCHYALVSTSIRISSGQLTIFPTRRKKNTSMHTLSPQKFKKCIATFSVSYSESFLIKTAHNMPPDSPIFFLDCIV